jgi:beta-glucosidase-like glycosyl hydrolase
MSSQDQSDDSRRPLTQRLADLMMVRIGSNLPPVRTVEQDESRVMQLLEQCPVGGLVLFNGRAEATPATLQRLQQASATPLLVAADIERGVGQQLHGGTVFPHQRAMAAMGDEAEAAVEEFARQTAREARAAGLHITFGPVADVNSDPRNPIIATRAFGEEPRDVARLVAAYVRGCRTGGILSTAKHFPGHGNTHEDSHHELPTVAGSIAELQATELVPFAAAIEAGVDLVMTAHVRYPALDPTGAPATVSRPILTDLLRHQMGFTGVVVSDSLLMEGVKGRFATEGELAIAALEAGVDLLLDVADPVSTLAALVAALESQRLREQRVEEAWQRVWRLRSQVSGPGTSAGPDTTDHSFAGSAALPLRIARRATQVLDASEGALPLDSKRPLSVVLLKPYVTHLDPPRQPLAAALEDAFEQVCYWEITPESPSDALAQLTGQLLQADQVCVAMVVKPAAWHRFGLPGEWSAWLRQLLAQRKVVVACLGSPEGLREFSEAAEAAICTYSDVAVSQQALVDCLGGKETAG